MSPIIVHIASSSYFDIIVFLFWAFCALFSIHLLFFLLRSSSVAWQSPPIWASLGSFRSRGSFSRSTRSLLIA